MPHLLASVQRFARDAVCYAIITRKTVHFLQPLLLKLGGSRFDLVIKELNELGLRIRCWIWDVVVAQDTQQLGDCQGRRIEIWLKIFAQANDLS